MTNLEIRIEMVKHNLKQWEVAKLLNMSESVFSRKLRKELSKEDKEKIMGVIKNAK